jgi:FkbM family methyltransferase
MRKLLLYYLRNFPLDYGKKLISRRIKINSDRPVKYTNKQGVSFELDLNEYQMKQIYLYDIYEKNTIRHLLKLFSRFDRKDLTIFDVGANIGFYSLTIAKNLSRTKSVIHSFEPNPVTYGLFVNNIAMNGFKTIVANQLGLSDKEETLTISYSANNLGAASVFAGAGKNTAAIHLTTMDTYCKSNNIEKVDCIKIDIEGSEFNFLKGAERVLAASEKLIVIMEIVDENCIKAGYTTTDIFDFMIRHGFKAYLPKPWPFGLKQIDKPAPGYHDNIFFLKGIQK